MKLTLSNYYEKRMKSWCLVFIAILLVLSCSSVQAQINYHDPVVLQNRTIDQNKPVGATPGSGAVCPDGSSVYTIPVYCPPGTHGMKPEIAITYNSRAGYGSLGWGWDISGLSSVSRLTKTPVNDGALGAVIMESSDALALDGNRLLRTSPVQGCTTYYCEYEDFSAISSQGSSGNGPAWFKVIKADGTVMEYGNSTDSKAAPKDNLDGTIGIWRLNKVTDPNGNYILYEYNSAGLINKIRYTGS